jgi:hypothetical protein
MSGQAAEPVGALAAAAVLIAELGELLATAASY